MSQNLADYAKEKGVKYFMISFTDLFGAQRAKLVPAAAPAAAPNAASTQVTPPMPSSVSGFVPVAAVQSTSEIPAEKSL